MNNYKYATCTCRSVILTVVPHVNLNASAAMKKCSDVGIERGASLDLVSLKVRVVTGIDPVVRQWL